MKFAVWATVGMCLFGHNASAEIWTSERECLQRQVDVQNIEGLLKTLSVEMSRASLEKVPLEKLGALIRENGKKLEDDIKEAGDLLRKICDGIFR